MKRLLLICTLIMTLPVASYAYKITYAEQWYKIYHVHLNRIPEDEFENLVYLEEALKAPFANPLYALAKIEDKKQWELYRYLFKMHVNLMIVRTYRQMAVKYDREKGYFYNAPWKKANLASLDIAEKYYRRALYFWQQAMTWYKKVQQGQFKWLYLSEVAAWHEEYRQIAEQELDFAKIIQHDLDQLQAMRTLFEAMDETTY